MKKDNDLIPLPNEEAKERAWQAARIAFKHAEKFNPVETNSFLKTFKWWIAGMATTASVAYMFFLANLSGFPPVKLPLANIDDIKVLENVRTLFPKNLRSIESTDDGVYQPVLSQTEETESVLPLVIEVKAGNKKKKVITFSGKTFTIPKPDGTTEEVEVYFNGNGEILLIGPTIMWRSNQENKDLNFQIKAESLPQKI